jgi:hypothetical protein
LPSYNAARLTAVGFDYLAVNVASGETKTLVAGVENKAIIVLGYCLNLEGAGTLAFTGTGGAAVTLPDFSFPEKGGAVYAGSVNGPAFELPEGAALKLQATGAVCDGHLTYLVVDALPL